MILKQHPGFQRVASGIAQQKNSNTGRPYGPTVAAAILAERTRQASPSAHRSNPRLNRVKGK